MYVHYFRTLSYIMGRLGGFYLRWCGRSICRSDPEWEPNNNGGSSGISSDFRSAWILMELTPSISPVVLTISFTMSIIGTRICRRKLLLPTRQSSTELGKRTTLQARCLGNKRHGSGVAYIWYISCSL